MAATPETGALSGRRGSRLDLRTETSIVVPLAALVILALLVSVLFVVRYAVAAVVEERIRLATRQSEDWLRQNSEELGTRSRLQPPSGALRLLLLDVQGIVISSSDGQAGWNARSGELEGLFLDRSPGGSVLMLGGDDGSADGARIATVRRLPGSVPAHWVRIDWPARGLADAQRTLRRTTWLSALSGLILLMVLVVYWRRRLRLLQGLIDRLRGLEPPAAGSASAESSVDGRSPEASTARSAAAEAAHLLATFDQAMERLRPGPADPLRDAFGESADLETGMLLLDASGQALALNDVGARWLGVGLPLPVGSSAGELFSHQAELAQVIESALGSGEPVQRREVALTAAGSAGRAAGDPVPQQAVVGLTLAPLRRAGVITGWLGLFADITGVHEAQRSQQLSHSLSQLAEMSAGLAHELRNGVSSLRGFTELLARSSLSSEQREDLEEMRREIDAMHRMAEDFLSFARPGTVRREVLDLSQVVRDATRDPALVELRVRWRPADPVASELPPIEVDGDRSLLERLFRNLLANARQSQERAGVAEEIEVSLGRLATGDAQVVIRDRGTGLPPGLEADELFVPFVHGAGGDTGLGLALTRRIADLHGGTVDLRGRQDGLTGAEALVTLPTRSLP